MSDDKDNLEEPLHVYYRALGAGISQNVSPK